MAVSLTQAQERVETIIKAAHELGVDGFALAKLRTVVTEQITIAMEAARDEAWKKSNQ